MYLSILVTKIGGHMQSWGGHFQGVPSLRGLEGGSPPLFQKKISRKVAKLANLKCQKGFKTIGSSKPGAISVSARGGAKFAPLPPWEKGLRVNRNQKERNVKFCKCNSVSVSARMITNYKSTSLCMTAKAQSH